MCANCHREIHSNLIDNSQLISSFNEQRAKEIDDIVNNKKIHKTFTCNNCGKEVSYGQSYCADCAHIKSRKSVRPSREVLKQLIRTDNFVSIGAKFGVTDNAIRK